MDDHKNINVRRDGDGDGGWGLTNVFSKIIIIKLLSSLRREHQVSEKPRAMLNHHLLSKIKAEN